MIGAINIITFLVGLVLVWRVLYAIRMGKKNIFMFFTILFFLFQFVPIVVETIYGGANHLFPGINLNRAILDETVAVTYDVAILIVISLLYYQSTLKDRMFEYYLSKIGTVKIGLIIKGILIYFILQPVILAFMAPNPSVYTHWAYSFVNEMDMYEEIYHHEVVMPSTQIALFATVIFYAVERRFKWLAYIAAFVITWITFKRTALIFSSIMIVAIDYLSGSYSHKVRKLVYKSSILILICVSYFILYSSYTGKGREGDPYVSYTMYYGRNYCVKTAIYDQLNGNKMLDYRGQSILFDLFFYIPRSVWPNKPGMYSKFSTSYSQGMHGLESSTNFYVNIWAEYISNFHLFGIFIALLFIKLFLRISEKSKNTVVYLVGVVFLCFYFFWGVQPFTMWIIGAWAISLATSKLKKVITV